MGIKTHVLLHLTTHENILDCFSECIHHRTKICSHEHCALEKEGRKQRKCSLRKRKVFCCNDKDAPTLAQMKLLVSGLRSSSKRKNSGKWIPDVQKGECGILNGFLSLSVRIVGGKVANIGDYPYMALLKMADGKYACGGSLINKWYVLTAAHCIEGKPT